jgi:uncharacterized protein YecE (DUF72 family)
MPLRRQVEIDGSSFRGPRTWNRGAHLGSEIIHIGCAGWNIPRQSIAHFELEGTHLQRYSGTFNCCEINSSFYRPHRYDTWKRWSASVPKDFRFSVKVPRTISHDVELKCEPEDLTAFLKQVRFMGQKLGVLLVQLPPSAAFDYMIARRFFALLRNRHSGDVVLEARHRTWFERRADDLLREFSIAGVAADPACVAAAGRPSGFGQVVYFRLHGSPRTYYSSYSVEFLKRMASRIEDLARGRGVRTWCIFDNTAAGFATSNALELSEEIAQEQCSLS